jgi:hypothetical protein
MNKQLVLFTQLAFSQNGKRACSHVHAVPITHLAVVNDVLTCLIH